MTHRGFARRVRIRHELRRRGAGRRWVAPAILTPALILGAVGCSSDDTKDSASSTTAKSTETTAASKGSTTTSADSVKSSDKVLRVLVTNDDGIGADGIDILVERLRKLPDTEVLVFAPKENQSGSGGKTTPGGAPAEAGTTKSGFPGTAVAGYPADSVIYALESGALPKKPHVVLSGINAGANIGPFVDLSGTVGAARAAAQRGIPALASSQGFSATPDYPSGVEYVLRWLSEHRDALLAGTAPVTVDNLNIPTCTTGSIRGEVTVPTATKAEAEGLDMVNSNCASTEENPPNDVVGFDNGYATWSTVPNTPAAG